MLVLTFPFVSDKVSFGSQLQWEAIEPLSFREFLLFLVFPSLRSREHWGTRRMLPRSALCGLWDLSSGSHACTESALHTGEGLYSPSPAFLPCSLVHPDPRKGLLCYQPCTWGPNSPRQPRNIIWVTWWSDFQNVFKNFSLSLFSVAECSPHGTRGPHTSPCRCNWNCFC